MKFLIFLIVCFVASVYSRTIVIRKIIEDEGGSEENIQPEENGNFLANLFNGAAQLTSKAVEGVGNIAQGALQGTASFGQGVVNGAQNGISSALENTADVASKLTNGVQNQVSSWWNALG